MGVPSIPWGGVDVTICLGDETVTEHCRVLDTDAFDIVIGTDFLRRNPQVKMLSLQRPYSLHCDFGSLWQWALLRTFGAIRMKRVWAALSIQD